MSHNQSALQANLIFSQREKSNADTRLNFQPQPRVSNRNCCNCLLAGSTNRGLQNKLSRVCRKAKVTSQRNALPNVFAINTSSTSKSSVKAIANHDYNAEGQSVYEAQMTTWLQALKAKSPN